MLALKYLINLLILGKNNKTISILLIGKNSPEVGIRVPRERWFGEYISIQFCFDSIFLLFCFSFIIFTNMYKF